PDTSEPACVQEHSVLLTRREQQVLALMLSGQDMNSIAGSLGIKRSTVIAHKKHLFLKSGVHTTSQLVVWAMLKQVCVQ
ncbi:MAG: helix-turn-helix transcriptional regulator, partial [Sphaerochaeta sp.]|nr:helix-turn-helix transcriptional regulator [Sphaerochaeta sp.]